MINILYIRIMSRSTALEILANYIDVHQKLKYLHQNPVEAGFVTKQKEYLL